MTAEEFTARASGLKAKIATMLGISASRIEAHLQLKNAETFQSFSTF